MATRGVGERIGSGRVSEVYAYGTDSVVKVPRDGVPPDWLPFEADLCQAVHLAGMPAPEVRDLVVVDGRTALVLERIHGPSMWEVMLDNQSQVTSLAADLAHIQRELHAGGVPPGIPDFVDRIVRRINTADALTQNERAEAASSAVDLPRGAALLHGDLHPGNVLMGASGPVVIDWFDAAIGHPVADVIRSSILMRPGRYAAPAHLPGAPRELLDQLHRSWIEAFLADLDVMASDLRRWQAVIAAGRLAEGAEIDEQQLVSLWQHRDEPGRPAELTAGWSALD